MGTKCSQAPCCEPAAVEEITVFDGGVDELAPGWNRASKIAWMNAFDDGYLNDSTRVTEEFFDDKEGAAKYDKQHMKSFKTYFDMEYDELAGSPVVNADIQEERPLYTFISGAWYEGQWLGNHRHGFGCQHWTDGASYEGQWRADQAYGHGRFQYKTRDTSYIGQWHHNMAHGQGIAYHPDRIYAGQWMDDYQSGFGIEYWLTDDAEFAGEFKNGTKEGFGTYQWPDGSTHDGMWSNGLMAGKGHFKGSDGRVVQGTWVDGNKTGMGKCTWKKGQSYAGGYESDQKHGFGIFTFDDGTTEKTFWKCGKIVDVQD
mmetsp:Transcript_6266/g.15575  ORF Transcript_6266/g.15575 Transcript_6266/m.15575 type:complete len:314 (+) Transcript_6266:42-983(+)